MTARLEVLSQNTKVIPAHKYLLNDTDEEIVIGRKDPSVKPVKHRKIELDVTIGLLESLISRSHAKLLFINGEWQIVDQSKNGTLVNGVKITEPKPLKPNDEITIGPVRLKFFNQ